MVSRVAYGTTTAMASQLGEAGIKGDYFCLGERRMAVVVQVVDMPRCVVFPNIPEGDSIEGFRIFGPCRDFICSLPELHVDTHKLPSDEGAYQFGSCTTVLLTKPGTYEFKLKSGEFLSDDFFYENTGIGIEWAKLLCKTVTNII